MLDDLTIGSVTRGRNNGEDVFIAQVSYTDVDGKRRFIRGVGATERQALQRRQANIAKRLAVPSRVSPTVRVEFSHWLASYGPKDLTSEVRRQYTRNLEIHVLPHIGDVQPIGLDRERLQRLFSHDLAELNDGAGRNAYKTLMILLSWSMKNDHISSNPLRTIEARKYTPAVHDDDERWIEKRTNVVIQLRDWLADPDCACHDDYGRVLFSSSAFAAVNCSA